MGNNNISSAPLGPGHPEHSRNVIGDRHALRNTFDQLAVVITGGKEKASIYKIAAKDIKSTIGTASTPEGESYDSIVTHSMVDNMIAYTPAVASFMPLLTRESPASEDEQIAVVLGNSLSGYAAEKDPDDPQNFFDLVLFASNEPRWLLSKKGEDLLYVQKDSTTYRTARILVKAVKNAIYNHMRTLENPEKLNDFLEGLLLYSNSAWNDDLRTLASNSKLGERGRSLKYDDSYVPASTNPAASISPNTTNPVNFSR